MKTILVTGAAGALGRALVPLLERQGTFRLRLTDRDYLVGGAIWDGSRRGFIGRWRFSRWRGLGFPRRRG